jgi:hypothetical protein
MVKSPLALWADLSAARCSAAPWQHVLLRRRFITRQSPSTSKSQPVAWFASDTGMDMAGNFAESRSAIDRQPTYKKEARPQETPFVFVLVDLFGRLSHALARPV